MDKNKRPSVVFNPGEIGKGDLKPIKHDFRKPQAPEKEPEEPKARLVRQEKPIK